MELGGGAFAFLCRSRSADLQKKIEAGVEPVFDFEVVF